jgi:hypothetical protein
MDRPVAAEPRPRPPDRRSTSSRIKVVRHWEGDKFDLDGAQVDVFPATRLAHRPRTEEQRFHGPARQLRARPPSCSKGDAEKAVEYRVASLYHPHADLLKVGHQGSAASTTPEILQAVKPTFA